MKTYLVGGAVRDRLLGLPVKDRDWVVVGETPASMNEAGFLPVGKDFPVFLHPQTQEEYALARKERKTGTGYHGFDFDVSESVTLEEDLLRRDLTINAIAEDEAGHIIDPYEGQRDIESRLIRHVSAAFSEDPVRVLRVARFYARLAPMGFKVAPETLSLMRDMVRSGEVDALVPERVWAELQKALQEKSPQLFFFILRECGALLHLFPELDQLFGVPQQAKHHPEVDTGIHMLKVLEQAAKLTDDPVARFAALTHDLGKGLTSPEEWPKHPGHEEAGLPVLDIMCDRLKVPNQYRKIAQRVMQFHGICHRAPDLAASTLLEMLEGIDAFRQPDMVETFLAACEADSKGRMGYENVEYTQAAIVRQALLAAKSVDAKKLVADGWGGEELGKELHRQRVASIKQQRESGLS